VGFAREGGIDRVFEVGDLGEAADRDLMLFDIVPDRFDARLLGARPAWWAWSASARAAALGLTKP